MTPSLPLLGDALSIVDNGSTSYSPHPNPNPYPVFYHPLSILGDALSIDENGSTSVGKLGGTYPDIEYVYRGVCAEMSGMHEYHIKVYALSNDLNAVVEKGAVV